MDRNRNRRIGESRIGLDGRLAAYLAAAGAVGVGMASEAQAIIVYNPEVQPFGIDESVPIDFNSDNQVDYEIDHDRLDLGGGNIVDFLQLDKNDTNGSSPGENPCPINVFDTFEPNGTPLNNTADAGYVINGPDGDYPAALSRGRLIGPASTFDFEEGDSFQGTPQTIRANRLIDEDARQCDEAICGLSPSQTFNPPSPPKFLGLGDEVRYLGVKMNLQSQGPVEYGWIGIRIANEADATGEVVGWAYETSGAPIGAGCVANLSGDYDCSGTVDAADYVLWRKNVEETSTFPNDPDVGMIVGGDQYNTWRSNFGNSGPGSSVVAVQSSAVPEPSSILLGMIVGLLLCSRHIWKRIIGR